MKTILRNTKGFTLIELMIVIAIIGILAAMAMSMFASMRMRSFNSAAQSDVRNMATNEAGLFTDVRSFGVSSPGAVKGTGGSVAYAGSAGGVGEPMTGPAAAGTAHTLTITVLDGKNINSGIAFDISSNVTAAANVEAIGSANPRAASYVVGAKHKNGNSYFAQDSDNGASYVGRDDGKVGAVLDKTDLPASTLNADDIAAQGAPATAANAKWQNK